jgi:hypothetical protein
MNLWRVESEGAGKNPFFVTSEDGRFVTVSKIVSWRRRFGVHSAAQKVADEMNAGKPVCPHCGRDIQSKEGREVDG